MYETNPTTANGFFYVCQCIEALWREPEQVHIISLIKAKLNILGQVENAEMRKLKYRN